jgi:hypothetical protein
MTRTRTAWTIIKKAPAGTSDSHSCQEEGGVEGRRLNAWTEDPRAVAGVSLAHMRAAAPSLASLGLVCLTAAAGAAAQPGAPTPPTAAAQQTDSGARLIILNVIARRSATLARIRQCRYEAFVKLAARDVSQPQDSARSVLLLSEVHSSAYWEHPDRYQETMEARHVSRDGVIRHQLVLVHEIAHFLRNNVDLEEGGGAGGGRDGGGGGHNRAAPNQQHSIALPIADDALDHYDFVVRDTLFLDGRRILRVAVLPKSDASPLFTGSLDIVDSTYDLLGMDLGVNDALRFPTVSHLRYQQRWRDGGDGWWMPYEIRLSGEVRPKLSARWLPRTVAGMALPEFPRQVTFEQVASLSGFTFEEGHRPADLAEYRTVVRDQTDGSDSTMWSAPEAVPLTDAERATWVRADSVDRHPALLSRLSRDLDAVQRVALGPGSFHFNRVDGFYLGVIHDWRLTPGATFTTKLGYALGSEQWQYLVGARGMLSTTHRIWVGASYHDETVGWPALVPAGYDPTASALVTRVDPSDYYRERGYTLALGTKLLNFTRLELRYDDALQSSQDTVPGLGFRSTRFPPLPNPPIRDGHLRSLSGTFTYDSRQLLRSGGGDYPLGGGSWTRITVGAEVAAPALIANDFSFRRYAFQLERRQQTPGFGTTTITVAGGIDSPGAPPQRYFTVGFGLRVLAAEGTGFNTLAHTGFAGNRALMVSLRHDFGRVLSLHGGVFWVKLTDNTPSPADTLLRTAPTPYAEWGFTLGHLTPFLSPLDLALSFTWQISSYPTRRFRFGFGITGP